MGSCWWCVCSWYAVVVAVSTEQRAELQDEVGARRAKLLQLVLVPPELVPGAVVCYAALDLR